WVAIDPAHARYDRSLALGSNADFRAAVSKGLSASRSDRHQAAYQLNAGVAQDIQLLLEREREGTDRPGLAFAAASSFEAALSDEPRSAIGEANLALARRLEGDKAGAVAAAAQALDLAPRDGTIAGVAATIFEWAGMLGEARAAYARAVTHDASLVQSPFWTTS